MTRHRLGPLAVLVALASALLVAPAPAQALVKPRVSIAVASCGIAGTVSGRSRGATVKLQQQLGTRWVRVATSKVTSAKTYSFTPSGGGTFRVRVVKNSRIRGAASSAVNFTTTSTPDESSARATILAQTNQFRADNGKPPLQLMDGLNAVAQGWSAYMACNDYFGHNVPPKMPGYFWDQYPAGWMSAGENVAAGQSPNDVVAAWIGSPPHRANLLGDFTHIGIGYATSNTSEFPTYFTQNFAKY